MDVFLARQPIFNKHRKLFGYELLFRTGIGNTFPNIDGSIATASLLSNLFFPFEVDQILGGKKGLINFTEQLILSKAPLYLPKDKFIIEVLEDVEPTPQIVSKLALFKDRGYKIALDDFVYHKKFEPMIRLSNVIKFDLHETPLGTLVEILDELKEKFNLKFLAEKIESYDQFKLAKKMGFHYFQGYFFARPEVLSTREVPTSQITKLKLINEVGKRNVDIGKIENHIKNDAPLSFKLLKYANSVYFNRKLPIDTIRDAISYIGEDEIRNFINIVVVSDLGLSKPNELVRLCIIRARMCEKLGSLLVNRFSSEELFTLGLFSLMDALMDTPMDNILEHLSFSEKMKTALLGKDQEFSMMLDLVTGLEQGDWQKPIFKTIEGSEIEKKLPEVYSESIRMANAFYD